MFYAYSGTSKFYKPQKVNPFKHKLSITGTHCQRSPNKGHVGEDPFGLGFKMGLGVKLYTAITKGWPCHSENTTELNCGGRKEMEETKNTPHLHGMNLKKMLLHNL